jgi:nitroreductase
VTSIAMDSPIDTILGRRSASRLVEPAPPPEQLDVVLRAATTVPDHGALHPWRFVVVAGAGRRTFADALVAAARGDGPPLDPARAAKVSAKAYVAPTCVVVVAAPIEDHKVPVWEQVASASCAGYAITLAAHAIGLGAVWKSVPFLDAPALRECFGVTGAEQLLGWVNLGTQEPEAELSRQVRAEIADHVSYLLDSTLSAAG